MNFIKEIIKKIMGIKNTKRINYSMSIKNKNVCKYSDNMRFIFVKSFKQNNVFILSMLCVFFTQSIRLGEYNWILNSLSFIILIKSIKMPVKYYLKYSFRGGKNA